MTVAIMAWTRKPFPKSNEAPAALNVVVVVVVVVVRAVMTAVYAKPPDCLTSTLSRSRNRPDDQPAS